MEFDTIRCYITTLNTYTWDLVKVFFSDLLDAPGTFFTLHICRPLLIYSMLLAKLYGDYMVNIYHNLQLLQPFGACFYVFQHFSFF